MKLKEKYRSFCEGERSLPIFKSWWLDSLVGENWDVCVIEKNDEIVAAMPYVLSSRCGFNRIHQPILTQHLGPWIKEVSPKYSRRLSQERELMTALVKQLPAYSDFHQNWHYKNSNWLPFFWLASSKQQNIHTSLKA